MDQLSEGTQFCVHQRNYEIVFVREQTITLKDLLLDNEIDISQQELLRLLENGKLQFLAADSPAPAFSRSTDLDFQSLPLTEQNSALRRYEYVQAIIDFRNKSTDSALPMELIAKIAQGRGESVPSERTVQRWIKRFEQSDGSIRGLIDGRHYSGNRCSKIDPEVNRLIDHVIETVYLRKEQPSIQAAYDTLLYMIDDVNRYRDTTDQLHYPSYQTLQQHIKRLPYFERKSRRQGKRAALQSVRQNRLRPPTQKVLECVEMDHTTLDLMVVDDENRLPLGRPTFTSMLDLYTHCVLGFHLGFEPPSYACVAKALKHAIMPKTYIAQRYPDIKHSWLAYGAPLKISVDNGKEFWGRDLELACLDLGIQIHHNPVGCPWYKGAVERHFRTVNQELLINAPGNCLADLLERRDYDPQKNAVISFSALLHLYHIWIVDVYHQQPRGKHQLIPAIAWQQATKNQTPAICDKTRLDIVLGKTVHRRLRAGGVIFQGIRYDSDALMRLRMSIGHIKVMFKVDSSDVGQINVWDQFSKRYLLVPALDQDYAHGLGLWQHKVIKRFARRLTQSQIDQVALNEAKQRIRDIIANESSKTLKARRKLARYQAIEHEPIARSQTNENDDMHAVTFNEVTGVQTDSPSRNKTRSVSRSERSTQADKADDEDLLIWDNQIIVNKEEQ